MKEIDTQKTRYTSALESLGEEPSPDSTLSCYEIKKRYSSKSETQFINDLGRDPLDRPSPIPARDLSHSHISDDSPFSRRARSIVMALLKLNSSKRATFHELHRDLDGR